MAVILTGKNISKPSTSVLTYRFFKTFSRRDETASGETE